MKMVRLRGAAMSAVNPLNDTASFAYSPGDVIAGKYSLEELLGEGGMGAVFRARNTAIDMPVALKLIRADLDRELLTGRLLQEARAAAKLSHPSIVRVFDVGQTALGDPFIVMELLQGETLATVIDRDQRVPSARAVQLLLPIADGLAVAHAKGFVHRDVKPDNVFIALDEEGQLQPKLVDFGIVKQVQQNGDSQLTQVGAVLGSPEYMSPEQARGLDQVDARSDVWSFCIVLYEAITGETPFQSRNYNALLRLIVESEPPTLRDLAAADGALSAIVARGLSKDPEARWPSMTELGKALASWLTDQGHNADACGVSLQARWLSRPSDPTALRRVSRTSWPDGSFEPPSGIRAVGDALRERLGRSTPPKSPGFENATTVHVAKQAETPAPLAESPVRAETTGKRQLPLLLAAAGGALLVAVGAWLALRSGPPGAVASEAPRIEAPVASGPPKLPAVASVESAAPSLTPSAQREPVPSAAPVSPPVANKSRPVAPRAAEPRKAPAPAVDSTPKAEPSDLLAPY
jgi:serine/threonine protein kinase